MHLSSAGIPFEKRPQLPAEPSVLAGFSADALTRTLLNGFYVVKTRLQVRRPRYHFCHAFVETQNLWREGILGFLRGNAAGCLRAVPYSAAKYATHRAVEPLLKDRLPAARAEWVANGLATAVAVAVTYPLNTLQTRIALLPLAQARYTHIINELANSKGGLLDGLYAGILSVIPGQLAYQAGLHLADKLFLAVIGPTDESQHPTRAFVQACLRATLANVLSYPFDTVCVRMQAGIFADKGVLHCIKSIYEEQGVGGFYQGVGVTLLKVLPFALFMYFAFHFSNQWFEKHGRDERFASLHSYLHTYWRALSTHLETGSLQWRSHAQKQFHHAE